MENTNTTISFTPDELLVVKTTVAEMLAEYIQSDEQIHVALKEHLPTEEAVEEFFFKVFPEGIEEHADKVDNMSPHDLVDMLIHLLNKLTSKENK